MPIAKVALPDGRIGRFEVPEGTTPDEVLQFAGTMQNQMETPKVTTAPAQEAQQPMQPLTLADKIAASLKNAGTGYLQGGKNVVMGGVQAAADLMGNEALREISTDAQRLSQQKYTQKVGDSTSAKVGEFLGEVAPFALLPAGGTSLASKAAYSAGGGAIAGATAPTQEYISRDEALQNRAEGGALGGVIGAAVPTAIFGARPALQKLFKINPTAARDFAEAGIESGASVLSDRPMIQQISAGLAQYPGSVGTFEKTTNKVLDDIQEAINRAGASKGLTTQEAGLVIQGGAEKYVDKFKSVASKLYNRLDDYIPASTKVGAANVEAQLSKELSGLPETLAKRRSANEGIKVLQDIVSDTSRLSQDVIRGSQRADINYSALKKYRSIVGEKLSKSYLLGGEDEAVLKRVYSAITADMEEAARAKGDKALKAFNRANSFYKIGAENIEKNLQKVTSQNTPEQIYQSAMSNTKLGGTKVSSIMKSLKPDEQEIVRGTVLKQLGGRGQDQFSTRTFLTQWDKMSPEARRAIFGRQETDINKITGIMSRLNSIDRFANPSGTGQRIGIGGLAFLSLIDTKLGAASLVGSYTAAKLLNSPKFTRWLAQIPTKQSPAAFNKQLGRLSKIAKKSPDIAEDIAKYVAVMGSVASRDGGEGEGGD